MWAHPTTITAFTFAFLQFLSPVEAVTFPLYARKRSDPATQRLLRRAEVAAQSELRNYGDLSYYTKIKVGDADFNVLIDTGSTDLWVTGFAPDRRSWGWPAEINYAGGSEKGIIHTATLVFDGNTVPEQAYINVTEVQEETGGGILGLGPTKNSGVRARFGSSLGDPPLERIFKQDPSIPNFLTVLLSRKSDDLNGPDPYNQIGQITVGRILPLLENILNVPKLLVPDIIGWQRTGHWQTMLDADGVFGPDGERILTFSSVPGGLPGPGDEYGNRRLNVVFDTGYSLPQLPAHVIHGIYGRIPGAKYVPRTGTSSGYYRNIPCNYELNVTFAFGGLAYPIHPLDLTREKYDPEEKKYSCQSTFQVVPLHVANHNSFGPFDGILGMSFLRNVYFLVDHGDYINGDTSVMGEPYIQLLSLTFEEDAHADFVRVRMDGRDWSSVQAPLLDVAPYWGIDDDIFGNSSGGGSTGNSTSGGSGGDDGEKENGQLEDDVDDGDTDADGDADSDADDDDDDENDNDENDPNADDDFLGDDDGNTKASDDSDYDPSATTSSGSPNNKKPWYKTLWFYIGAAVVGVAIIIGSLGIAICLCCRRRRSSLKTEQAFLPTMAGAGAYKPLNPQAEFHHSAGPATHGAGYGGTSTYTTGASSYDEPKYHYGSA